MFAFSARKSLHFDVWSTFERPNLALERVAPNRPTWPAGGHSDQKLSDSLLIDDKRVNNSVTHAFGASECKRYGMGFGRRQHFESRIEHSTLRVGKNFPIEAIFWLAQRAENVLIFSEFG